MACLTVGFTFSFFIFHFSFGQETTQPVVPTTQPAQPAQSIAQIEKWFDNLASSEPQVRDDARTKLLGLGKIDLDTLREVVRRSVPLAPSQSGVLHDIVVHVYLAATNDQ